MKKDIIYLTGFMGSGKSTIGPILANTIGYEFVDIDKTIETAAKKTIMEIFADNGEGYFRELEKRAIQEISKAHGHVVSLGGGTITKQENLSIIRSTGVLVYLKMAPEEILQRLKFKADRPLLRAADGTLLSNPQLLEQIVRLLTEREPFYSQADVIVHAAGKKVEHIVDEIVRKIRTLIE